MDEISAPSFSLGLDDDPPAPSFSLGLDLDFADLPTEGEEDESEPSPLPNPSRSHPPHHDLEDFTEDPRPQTLASDLVADDRRLSLKRLRRGPGFSSRRSSLPAGRPPPNEFVILDDDIEEFSSPEKRRNQDKFTSLPSHATCSTSKFSLHSRGILTSQPAKTSKASKITPLPTSSTSANIGTSSNSKLFPEFISPLRKFCLVDSDSDDPSSSKDIHKDAKEINASLKARQFTSSRSATRHEEKTTFQYNKVQTPVLDEFCEEYFRSAKDTKADQRKQEDISFIRSRVLDPGDSMDDFQQKNVTRKTDNSWNSPHPQPSAYRYFYHDDAKIRALVRERFRYFFPLGADDHRGNQQSTAENLDYMSQFGSRDVPSRGHATHEMASEGSSRKKRKKPNSNNAKDSSRSAEGWVNPKSNITIPKDEGSSRKKRKKPNSNNAKESSRSAEGWVNPKSNIAIPKDAGKRRVSADGKQSGHWFTGQDGRKVYVTKNGEELTGRAAYTNYKKDKGGFGRPRKKAAVSKRKR